MTEANDPLGCFIGGVSFRFLQPEQRLPRGHGGLRHCLGWLGVHLDVLNTRLPAHPAAVHERMRLVSLIPRMSTLAIGAIVNQAVALMPEGQAYLNIGVWNGFTFLAGVVGHRDKTCIGVDNFCKFGGPRVAFRQQFERLRSPAHSFHDMDYRDYFAQRHRAPLGVYYFDGPHTHEDQFNGLKCAEPFLAPGSVVLVDDTNGEAARSGTLDFIAQSRHRYRLLLDQRTARNCHPTYWNGLMVFRHEG